MAYTPQSWRKLYSRVITQKDPLLQSSWCETLRQMMQQRLIELSSGQIHSPEVESERTEIEAALRRVWEIEQKARQSGDS
jgi:hypothetical protein